MDSSWKNSWHTFFFLSELPPLLKLRPFEKKGMKSDACHILRTVHARVLKFHVWIPHGKIGGIRFVSSPSYLPFWSYAPLKKSEWNFVSKISRKVWARGLKLGQLIVDDEQITWFKKTPYFPWFMALWKVGLVSNISENLFELGVWNLVKNNLIFPELWSFEKKLDCWGHSVL